jgi:hypothetical protein
VATHPTLTERMEPGGVRYGPETIETVSVEL